MCELGLRTLSMVAMIFVDNPQYEQHYPMLSDLFQRCLTAPGGGVHIRLAAIAAASNLGELFMLRLH